MIRFRYLFLLLWVSVICSLPLFATHPQTVQFSTAQQFLRGDFQGISVSSDGRLILAPSLEEVSHTEQPFIECGVLSQSRGHYVRRRSYGKICRLRTEGSGSEFATLPEPGVYALAIDSQNRILAATGPDGKVYRIDSQGQEAVFYDPDEKYIWSMVLGPSGDLYVGTGPRGRIYRVNAQGNGSLFYDSS